MRIIPARPSDVPQLLAFRSEAAAWLSRLGTDQWQLPYPAARLLETVEDGTVFMVLDGPVTAATVTVTADGQAGLWTEQELSEPSMFISKLSVARTHGGQNIGGRLLDWAGDRARRAGAEWLRLDAWTTNKDLQAYYLRQGFEYVRTVLDGGAINGGPRVSGWLAQRSTGRTEHGFVDETPEPARLDGA
ncbi:GNAT family N-acetyltransferase [Streptomyces aurantiacus]|uniref:GNAT family N-acetyltransferase n=1 Tax=Streptomyces aurantiacus TaxID=47760 RepID=UPI0006E39034|nr:GNAT family N-acetyltransferase [Streptomyces aurantiacus]